MNPVQSAATSSVAASHRNEMGLARHRTATFHTLLKQPRDEQKCGVLSMAVPQISSVDAADRIVAESTYQFGELGMFGRQEAAAEADGDFRNAPAFLSTDAAPADAQCREADGGGENVVRQAGCAAASVPQVQLSGMESAAVPMSSTGEPAATAVGLIASPAAGSRSRITVGPVFREFVSGYGKVPKAVLTSNVRPGCASLVVSGPGGGLAVAVRSPVISDPAKLRALFDEVAREYGVEIHDLRVNGSFAERVNQVGGPHGGRTR